MDTIGIRELQQNASRYIRQVEAGEIIEVTARGRPVARIVPIRAENALEQLINEGRATRAAGDLLAHKPMRLPKGMKPPSEVLAELREFER